MEDGYVTLGSGRVVGTTVLKKVQVYEKEKGVESNIKTVESYPDKMVRYNLDGRKLTYPQKGINIIRQSDGTTRKVIVK